MGVLGKWEKRNSYRGPTLEELTGYMTRCPGRPTQTSPDLAWPDGASPVNQTSCWHRQRSEYLLLHVFKNTASLPPGAESTYQNGVSVGTHGGAEPLVGLDLRLMVCVIDPDGAIP